jgi:hypothetical protein
MTLLYLDQCHWSDIARRWASPADVRRLREMAGAGKVQLVLSIAHVVETLQCRQKRVERLLTECFCSMASPIWIKSQDLIIKEEIVAYFREFIGRGAAADVDPFSAGLFRSVGLRKPAPLAARKRRPSVKSLIRFIESASPRFRQRILGLCDTETTPLRLLYHARSGPASTEAIKGFVDLYAPKTLPGGAPVGAHLRRAFLVQFDLAKCPALMNLVWIVHHMSRAGLRPEPGDILDLYHAIPAYTYCDVFVTDKRVADFIRRLRNPEGRFAATFKGLPAALRHVENLL